MALGTSKRIISLAKREIAERVLGQALGLLGNNPEKNAKYVISAIDHITKGEKQGIIRDWVHNWLDESEPGRQFLGRMLRDTHPNVRRRYIARMLVSMLFRDPEISRKCLEEYGVAPPYTMIISPTMRCNYRCQGCYAASYERNTDMKPEVFDRILGEAEDIGINFFSLVGGEPFIYPELLEVLGRHKRSFFQIYTNGSLIDKSMAEKLVNLGNIAPQVSVNGPLEYTDASRGKGAFVQVEQAMDNLHQAGCVFGFSTLVTRYNMDAICSEEWIDFLVDKGALYGWLFLYMPVGDDPDMRLMPTPQQRNQMRMALRHFQHTKPILMVDFWNHGTLTGGCIAGGRLYLHINHRGDVEPCIFCHFATHNINDCSLVEALASPFFTGIKESQPFSYNTLRPCPMIDHHQQMWSIIQQCGAKPTHVGAEKMFTTFAPDMQKYCDGVREIMDDVWDDDDYHEWVPKWSSLCGIPPARLEARRQAFEESRKAKRNLR
jgi:MoaA/NifB/PqqE/SkfB family radical SAM enzyme